jgi:hypothetical protein
MCGITCLLLIVLWVRSYPKTDTLSRYGSNRNVWQFRSYSGTVSVNYVKVPSLVLDPSEVGWEYWRLEVRDGLTENMFDWTFLANPKRIRIRIPNLLLIFLSAALASLPWIRWRFSLRTLLIATTLVAVVLGMIVWAAK